MTLRRLATLMLVLVLALGGCNGGGGGNGGNGGAEETERVAEPEKGCTKSHPTKGYVDSEVPVSLCVGEESLRFANESNFALWLDADREARWSPESDSGSADSVVQWQEDLRNRAVEPYLPDSSLLVLPGQAGTITPPDAVLQWSMQREATVAVLAIDHLVGEAADRFGGPRYRLNASMEKCSQGAVRQFKFAVDQSQEASLHQAVRLAILSTDCKGFWDALVDEQGAVQRPVSVPEAQRRIVNRAQQFEDEAGPLMRFLRRAARVGNAVR
jgi:hypothetical protein